MRILVYKPFEDQQYREIKIGESCANLIRRNYIPFCEKCGAVVVQPMIHLEWHQKREEENVKS